MSNCKIKDLLTLQRGFDITKKEQLEGPYPVVSSSGITSFHSEFMVKGPGVVIGRKGSLGTAFYIKSNFWPHDTTLWVKDFKGNDPYYIYCLLQSLHLEKLDSGSANPTLNRNYVHEVEVFKVGAQQQKNIRKIAFAIDQMINTNLQICSELESMAKTIYDYWFVQFDFPDENGRPYRTSGGEMVWNAQLKREIPKGWNCVSLERYIAIGNTSVDPASLSNTIMEHYSIPAYDEGGYPAFESAETIQSGKYRVHKDAILVSKLNPQFKRIWDPYCITENAICSTEFMVYQAKQKKIRPFCFALVNSDGFCQHMISKAISSTGSRKRIQPDVSLTYQFAAPDTESLLLLFSEIYQPIMDKLKNTKLENHEMTKLRNWLLPMLMNGQARVE